MDDKAITAIKKLDKAMMELLDADTKLLNEEIYSLWMALMMSIGMEPDCTESYQTLANYQHITGSGINMEAYEEAAYLSAGLEHGNLDEELRVDYANIAKGLPDGKYYVYGYHHINSCLLYTSPSPRDS